MMTNQGRDIKNVRGNMKCKNITHFSQQVFGCITYTKMPNYMCTRLDVKDIKYLFRGYYKGIKIYMLIYLETKIKSLDMVFFKDKICLKDHPNVQRFIDGTLNL